MELREWMKDNRWTITAMANEIGVSFGTLSGIRRKTYKASLQLKKAIERFTNGEVTLDDLLEEKNKPKNELKNELKRDLWGLGRDEDSILRD